MSLFSATGRSGFFGRELWTQTRRRRKAPTLMGWDPTMVDRLGATFLSTLTVTNTNNSGKGSLRYEVNQANSGDLIQFASNLQGSTIKLTSGPIAINESLAIAGFNIAQVTVSAGGKSQVFVVNTPSGELASLEGMTITGGVAPFGGAILNEGGGALYLGVRRTHRERCSGNRSGRRWARAAPLPPRGPARRVCVEQCVFSSNEAMGANGDDELERKQCKRR